ncbi:uncharacterized protein LOC105009723 isoform X2 [Esox lucius]|uniref:uncharacterized protein LOC105009723 isoform X2 n=1 Tax=Esox lucius TaxID=8010 RepID=UPI0014777599|nr:uncharacterized protein LOC105009723 isoform X2 [Esox lucius]
MPAGPFSYCFSQGILLLSILHYVVGESLLIHKTVGDSVELPGPSPTDGKVTSVVWKYGGKDIAEYNSDVKYFPGNPLEGRLEMNSKNLSLTVKDLKLQDSGTFSVTGEWAKGQIPTKTITLKVHAEGVINLIFNASNQVSEKSASTTVSCVNETIPTGMLWHIKYIGIPVGGAVVVILIVAVVIYNRMSNKTDDQIENTIYTDVGDIARVKDTRSNSDVITMSIYETVDDYPKTKSSENET